MNTEQRDALIEALSEYELTLARLYETFAEVIPAEAERWRGIAKEERLHAKWINTLHGYLKDEKISFEQSKITIQATQGSIAYIEGQIQHAKTARIDVKQAVALAINVERSLLESAFLKVFKLKGTNATEVRQRLVDETKKHLQGLLDWQKHLAR